MATRVVIVIVANPTPAVAFSTRRGYELKVERAWPLHATSCCYCWPFTKIFVIVYEMVLITLIAINAINI